MTYKFIIVVSKLSAKLIKVDQDNNIFFTNKF